MWFCLLHHQGFVHSEIFTDHGLVKPISAFAKWAKATQEYGAGKDSSTEQTTTPDTFNLDFLTKIRGYFEKCTSYLQEVGAPASTDGDLSSSLYKALDALKSMLARLDKAVGARCMKAITNKEIDMANKDMVDKLPQSLHGLCHVLQVPWEKEHQEMTTMDLSNMGYFISKLSVAEAAYAASSSKELNQDTFKAVRDGCNVYATTFADLAAKAVDQAQKTYMAPLEAFHEKYQQVPGCIETWNMKEIEWVFISDTQEEVTTDVTNIRAAKKALDQFMADLGPLANHKSSQEAIAKLSQSAHNHMKQIQERMGAIGKVVAQTCFAHLYCCGDPAMCQTDVASTEKFTQKYFNIGRKDLPAILQEKVEEVNKRKPQPAESKKDKGKDKDKVAANEKEKVEKATKGDKPRKRVSDAEASSKADKKSKKAKKSR